MPDFAKVFQHRIKPKRLEKIVEDQIRSKNIFPRDAATIELIKQHLQRPDQFYGHIWQREGEWNFNLAIVVIKKPKIQLIPYDVFYGDDKVHVRDLATGKDYTANRINPYFGSYEKATGLLYELNDPIAIIAQVAEHAGIETTLGASYSGELIAKPRIQTIKGEPMFLPQWLVPVSVGLFCGHEYLKDPFDVDAVMKRDYSGIYAENSKSYLETREFLERTYGQKNLRSRIEEKLLVKGGVVCDGFFGHILEGQLTDVVGCDQNFQEYPDESVSEGDES